MRTSGARLTRLLPLLTLAAVVAIFGLAWLYLRREESRALEEFTVDQRALAAAFSATLQARIDGVLRDLRTAASEPVGPGDVAEEAIAARLRRLVADGALYREADLVDGSGIALAEICSHPGECVAGAGELRRARTALLASAKAGAAVSPPLGEGADRGRFRIFAAPAGPHFVTLVVDGDRLLEGIAAGEGAAPMRLLLLDEGQRFLEWAPGGTRTPATGGMRAGDPLPAGDLRVLLHRMGEERAGAVPLDRDAASALGLDHRRAVAGFSSVRVGAGSWSIAVATSAMRVRDRTRVGTFRLAAATGLAALFAGAFGLFVAMQQRRAAALHDALRLAAATAALRERSEKIVEAIPLGVLALDGDGKVTAVNPFLAERGANAGGTLAQSLPRAEPTELAAIEALLAEARQKRTAAQRGGLRIHLGSDGARDIDVYAIPLGRPLADTDCFLVLHDRTETRSLERNLARAEKLATIGTLAAGVAHEVGTPLGIISGRAEQLLSRIPDGEAGEPMRKGVTSILAQVDKVSTTIRQLLDFSRVRPIEATTLAPASVLETARALLEHRFRQSKVGLTVEAGSDVPAISGDPGQLEQVFVNLLMNAVDACAAGGSVKARALAREGAVVFEIADDGAGIAPEHLPSVLDPFTTKKRGQGTGLGLTIAADIVRNHGGTLEIDSALGAGTTARVQLPKAKGPA